MIKLIKQTISVAQGSGTLETSYEMFHFEHSKTLAAFSEDISSGNRLKSPGLNAAGCEVYLSYCVGLRL